MTPPLVARGKTCVLWLDPGKMTGWARLRDGKGFESGEAWPQLAGDIMQDHCRQSREALVGWEQFNITPATYRLRGSSETIEIIGVIRWLAIRHDAQILPAASRQARMTVSSETLKKFGWYRPGLGHANDAARHLLAWMIRSGALEEEHKTILSTSLGW
jgi:hypothetical protein